MEKADRKEPAGRVDEAGRKVQAGRKDRVDEAGRRVQASQEGPVVRAEEEMKDQIASLIRRGDPKADQNNGLLPARAGKSHWSG